MEVEISQQIEFINNHIAHSNKLRFSIQSDIVSFETLYSQYTECVQNLGHTQNPMINVPQPFEIDPKLNSEKDMYEEQLKTKSINLSSNVYAYINELNKSLNLINSAQSLVFDKFLVQWKREQQMISIGYKISTNINVIQTWCEKLYDMIWLTRSHIKEADNFGTTLSHFNGYFELQQSKEIINVLLNMSSQLLSSLVANSFIITIQPPQVLKTNSRFSAEACLLIGGKLNFQMTSPLVVVSIVNENQANQIISRNKPDHEFCGEILNCLGNMEYQNSLKRFAVTFKSMQLKKIIRTGKKGTDSVTDEKFSILFTSKFFIGNELQFEVWTLSLPVVVIVHGNQEPHAWATVTWDNAFSESGRIPFNVPDKVPWRNVAVALSKKFSSVTGRELSDDSLIFLAEKVFRMQNVDFNNMVLSWTMFCKVTLPQRNFTFWEWFYAVMKLTRDHLKGPWIDGAILGFIKKSDAEEMLTRYMIGTFLLRFSDSELGGLTVAWTASNYEVFSLHPFSAKDLSIRSLADRLMDLSYLIWLYPCIDKTQAFKKYCTPPSDISTHFTNSGYVKPLLVTHVPGMGEPGSSRQRMNSYSSTPQNHQCYVNSPESCNIRKTSSVQSEPVNTMMAYGNNSADINVPMQLNYGNDGSSMDEVFFE